MKALRKVKNEIERLELQRMSIEERLETLYKERTQLENTEMIQAIREAEFDASDMIAVVQAIKKGGHNLSELLSLATNMQTNTEEDFHDIHEEM